MLWTGVPVGNTWKNMVFAALTFVYSLGKQINHGAVSQNTLQHKLHKHFCVLYCTLSLICWNSCWFRHWYYISHLHLTCSQIHPTVSTHVLSGGKTLKPRIMKQRNKQLSLRTILYCKRLYCNALHVANVIYTSVVQC